MSLNREYKLGLDTSGFDAGAQRVMQQAAQVHAQLMQLNQGVSVGIEDMADTFTKFVSSARQAGENLQRGFAIKGRAGFTPFEKLTKDQAAALQGNQKWRYNLLQLNKDLQEFSNQTNHSADQVFEFYKRIQQIGSTGNQNVNYVLNRMGAQFQNLAQSIGTASAQADAIGGSGGGGGGGGRGRGGGGGGGPNPFGRAANNNYGQGARAMAQHSQAVADSLLHLQSAAQGVMMGTSILQRNVTSLAFSMVFLKYSIIPITIAVAGLTAVIGGAAGLSMAFEGLLKSSEAAGRSLESLGQRLTNYFQSAEEAQKILQMASQISKNLGFDRNDAAEGLRMMDRWKLTSKEYVDALTNTAAANGQTMTDVASRFQQIMVADVNQKSELVRQMAKDYDLPIKHYATTLDLARALNQRFAGSAEQTANTTDGLMGRVGARILEFKERIGTLVNQVIKPFFEPVMAFFDALIKGFGDSEASGKKTGELDKNLQGLAATVKQLTPAAKAFGYLLGKVTYDAIMILVHVVKTLIDTALSLWTKLKPIVDFIMIWIHAIKTLISWIISWYNEHRTLVNTILGVLAALALFNLAVAAAQAAVKLFISAIRGLIDAILGVPNKTINIFTGGEKEARQVFKNIQDDLNKLRDKMIKVDAEGDDAKLQKLLDKYNQLKDKMYVVREKIITEGGPKGDQPVSVGTNKPIQETAMTVIRTIIPGLIGSTAALLTPEIALPLAIALAVAIVAALVAIFPKQTGMVAGAILRGFADAMALVIAGIGLIIIGASYAFALPFIAMWAGIRSVFGEGGRGVAEALLNFSGTIMSDMRDLFTAMLHGDWRAAFGDVLDIIKSGFVDLPFNITKSLSVGVWHSLPDFVKDPLEEMKRITNLRLGDVSGIFDTTFSVHIPQALKDWGAQFKTGFQEQFQVDSWATDIMGRTWHSIINPLWDIITAFENGLIDLWGWLNKFNPFSGLLDKLGDLWDKFKTVGSGVSNFLRNPSGAIGDFFGNFNPVHRAFGGVVPGPEGKPQLVMAHGGEVFLGAPAFARSRNNGPNSGTGGGGDVNIYMSNSVITNERAMDEFAGKIMERLSGRLTLGRSMSFHRVG